MPEVSDHLVKSLIRLVRQSTQVPNTSNTSAFTPEISDMVTPVFVLVGFVIPGWSEGPDPESRDSGFALCAPRNDSRLSVLCDGFVGEIENRLGKRKLQHDLAFIVRDFEDRTQQTPLGAFGLQQFPDHGPRNFPCAIGIAQLFAFGIGD